MSFYREKFPTETITPKLHMLEDHVVPFLRKWESGLGLYGEQGGEGIHPEFNRLNQIYCRMTPDTRRLHSMMKEHHIRSNPEAKSMKPEIKRRKVSEV